MSTPPLIPTSRKILYGSIVGCVVLFALVCYLTADPSTSKQSDLTTAQSVEAKDLKTAQAESRSPKELSAAKKVGNPAPLDWTEVSINGMDDFPDPSVNFDSIDWSAIDYKTGPQGQSASLFDNDKTSSKDVARLYKGKDSRWYMHGTQKGYMTDYEPFGNDVQSYSFQLTESNYAYGMRHGEVILFRPTRVNGRLTKGNPVTKTTWSKGVKVKEEKFNEDGSLMSEKQFKDKVEEIRNQRP